MVGGSIVFLGYVYPLITCYSQHMYIDGDIYSLNSLFLGLTRSMKLTKIGLPRIIMNLQYILCHIVPLMSHTHRLNLMACQIHQLIKLPLS